MAERARAKGKKATAKKKAPKGAQASRGKVAKTAAKPGIGHNSGSVPDEVYDRHLKRIDQTAKAMDKAKLEYDQKKGEHRSAFRAAKDDGVNIDAVRIARELDKQDAGVVVTNYSDVGRVLRLMESPLADQMDLFQNIEVPLPANATLAGTQAFKSGNDRSTNPYKAGTAEYVNFDTAWKAEADKATLKDGEGQPLH